MPKASTPSFILEIPLVAKPKEDRVMVGRLDAGRRLFNAVLNDGLKRLDAMRSSAGWLSARTLPNGKPKSNAFRVCNKQFGFSDYDFQSLATKHKNAAKFDDRLGANETQKIGTTVWKAVSEYAFGLRGRPRFKGKNRPLHSLEGKDAKAGIRWKPEIGVVEWGKLVLTAILPSKTQDPYVHQALSAKTKYSRIVWRREHGKRRWFVQLVQDGEAPAKYDFHTAGQIVGLDIGPSTIAVVADEAVSLQKFAPSVDQPWKEIKRLQRAQDRSRRATNPDNFNTNGTAKRNAKTWKKSERYKARQAKLAEVERVLAATRKKEHGTLANEILGLGTVIQTEMLSYKSFQKNFGRSSKVRAPGAFISLLSRKAESAGGTLIELDTRRLRMSQYDHVLGTCEKKPLSQRWHRLGGSSTIVQRDCYSAFLAKHAQESKHDSRRLNEGWTAAEPLLRRTGLCIEKSASGFPSGSPTVAIPSERIARQKRLGAGLGQNRKVLDTPTLYAFGTPAFRHGEVLGD